MNQSYSDDKIILEEFKVISSISKLTREQLEDVTKFYVVQAFNMYRSTRDLMKEKLMNTPITPSESYLIH